MNPLSDMRFANIFSHSISCLFILLMVSFAVPKIFLVWCIPTCLFLLLLPLLLMSDPKNIIAEANVKEFITYVFFKNFKVSSLTFKSLIHVVCCCVHRKTVAYFHSFTCSCPVFPTSFTKETVFSSLYILGSFVVNVIM